MAQYKGAASEAGRAMHLMKKREKQREQMEQMKQRIAEENIMKSNIDKKFSAHYDAVEAELKSSTVGLVTLNDMKAKQEALVKEREKQLAKKEQSKELQLKLEKLREKERKKEAKRKISSLSFTLEEEDEAGDEEEEATMDDDELEREEITTKKRKLGKNPDVDTSFLPDRDREEEENRLREELRQEWEAKQEKIKSEEIEITFSYWDGSGHRRTVKMKKGNTMQQFLQKALEILRKDFSELRSAGVEQLMYIKEDLIIPHHHSFYDFIVTKARGKSGPLFNFDVHDDVRLLSDATVEKDESHAGKVVLRSWYEKNKHIFPASRWEPYDPEKKWDKYTVQKPSSTGRGLAWLPGGRPAWPCSARLSFSVPSSCTRSGDVEAAQPQPLRLPAAPSLRPQDSRRPAPCSRDVTGPAQPLPLPRALRIKDRQGESILSQDRESPAGVRPKDWDTGGRAPAAGGPGRASEHRGGGGAAAAREPCRSALPGRPRPARWYGPGLKGPGGRGPAQCVGGGGGGAGARRVRRGVRRRGRASGAVWGSRARPRGRRAATRSQRRRRDRGRALPLPLGRRPDWSFVPGAGRDGPSAASPRPDGDPLWRRSGPCKDRCGASIH
ncbi:protein FAM50A [Phocoena phocoena]|uniref:protein FAM50A n=2 Tax=Odontoceti TaxID=9722 RepID=UPI0033069F2F